MDEGPRRKKRKRARGSPLLLWALIGAGAAIGLGGVAIGAVLILNASKGSGSASSPAAPPAGAPSSGTPAAPSSGAPGGPAAGALVGTPGNAPAAGAIEIKADALARDLVAHLQDNEGFHRKYGGVPLLVEGRVKYSGESLKVRGEYVVLLVGHTEPGLGEVIVACIFRGSEIAEARKVQEGESVRIACKLSPVSGNAKGVVLEDCQVAPPR
ncbi:MAG TPA: hypothetical protein VMS17_06710 [Gemmataceae bacterium]|nr:hypothetical protein [Gemmataceae bacterium]